VTDLKIPVFRLLVLPAVIAAATFWSCTSGAERFPIQITQARAEQGRQLYLAQCASCHGTPDTPPPLPAAPPHTVEGHTWHHADRDLFDWVLDRPPLATQMPGFRGILTNEEVLAVLAYIKSTWPEDVRNRQTAFSESYERQLRDMNR
jgi:mono/diheme cytochrome c family protein